MGTLFRLLFLIFFALAVGWYLHPPLREELAGLAASLTGEPAPAKKSAPAERARRPRREAPAPEPTAAPRGVRWEIEGEVYDLLTLKPVAGASVTFREDPTLPGETVATDATGRYRARVAGSPMKGLIASFSHPEYQEIFLEETRAPYKRWSLERRRDAYAEALTAEVLHVPLFADPGAPLTYNIAALSKRGSL